MDHVIHMLAKISLGSSWKIINEVIFIGFLYKFQKSLEK